MTTQAAPIHESVPQPGYYKYRRHREAAWEPAAIFLHGGELVCRISNRMEDPHAVWTFLAGNPMPKDEVLECFKTGRWRSDLPPVPEVKVVPEPPKPIGAEAGGPVLPRKVGPGDNSRDPVAYVEMVKEGLARVIETGELLAADPAFAKAKATLEADAGAALGYFEASPIKIKADADKCENWRLRIAGTAKALDAERERIKAPFFAITKEIDARYFPVIRAAQVKADQLDRLGQAWVKAEDARKLKEAEAAARAAVEEARAAEEKARAEHGWPQETQPELPAIVAPVVQVEKTLIGTGSRRRGAKADKPTAVIVDLAAAAAYFAEQRHPELVALLQKLADKAAGATAKVPGCVMSWETKPAQQAAE